MPENKLDTTRSVRRLARIATAAALVALLGTLFAAAAARAAEGPVWDVRAPWGDTNLPPGGEGQFAIVAHNVGDETTEQQLTITDELPEGVIAKAIHWSYHGFIDLTTLPPFYQTSCSGVGTETVTCTTAGFLPPFLAPAFPAEAGGYLPPIFIDVEVDPEASGSGTNVARVEGGGDSTTPRAHSERVPFGATPSSFDVVPGSFTTDLFNATAPFGQPARQAGGHPAELRTKFELDQKSAIGLDGTRYADSNGLVRSVEVTLPRGLVGDPEATPKCDPTQFAESGSTPRSKGCPADTQVGYITVALGVGTERWGQKGSGYSNFFAHGLSHFAIYNLQPPKGQVADFAFDILGYVQAHIYPTLDPAQNYAIKTVSPNISALDGLDVRATEVTFWGVPGDPAHDRYRFYPKASEGEAGAPFGSSAVRPLLTEPSDCGFDNGGARIRVESYQDPGVFTPVQEYGDPLNVTGCEDPRFRFEPDISLQPTSRAAGGPTGLAVTLKTPQRSDAVSKAEELYPENEDVKGISTPPLKKAVVTLPKGMTVNPSAAQGLGSCSPAQIGMGTDSPVTCPDASQFGTLKLKTPILPVDAQPEGWIYVAKPYDNPFHSFLSLYLVIQEPDRGILVKIAGRADLDPNTGQITFTFDDLPQLPLSESTMSVKSGLRAGLVEPQTCGTKTIEADFYSWQEPTVPRHVSSHYEITRNPDGSPCYPSLADRPFGPSLSGGTVNNAAGSFSPVEIHLSRTDQDQELKSVEGSGPPGLLASIKGLGRCSDAAIAAAANPERTGTEELEHPSCPADSQVGTVDAGAGTGQVLTYVPGKIYLAGPYKGAPLSGVAIVPAMSGPFDLGVVVTRAPAFVNPQNAQLTVKTDPLPQIFKGVPLRVRDIQVHLNRSHFTLNPTNCDPFALAGTMFSTEGKSMNGGSPFQAADCASLGFRPKLATRLFGGATRGSHPKFRGVYHGREGDANAKSVVVTMPRSEFLDQSHIRTVCTRVQFAAGGGNGEQCPAGSVYGHAEARTPLLDETLQGPVYLRSSNHKLPDLVAELHGIVDVEVDGRIDSIGGGIRANFESIPDVPVESFTIAMQGGKKGLLVNSRSICAHDYRASAAFAAQNGKETTLRPKLQAHCGGKAKRHHHR